MPGLAWEQAHRIVLPGLDAPDSCKGKIACQSREVRQAQNLEPAVSDRLGKKLCVLNDDDGPEIEFATLPRRDRPMAKIGSLPPQCRGS
jgi:hypothetical protein